MRLDYTWEGRAIAQRAAHAQEEARHSAFEAAYMLDIALACETEGYGRSEYAEVLAASWQRDAAMWSRQAAHWLGELLSLKNGGKRV
jgi:hypothetical protein